MAPPACDTMYRMDGYRSNAPLYSMFATARVVSTVNSATPKGIVRPVASAPGGSVGSTRSALPFCSRAAPVAGTPTAGIASSTTR